MVLSKSAALLNRTFTLGENIGVDADVCILSSTEDCICSNFGGLQINVIQNPLNHLHFKHYSFIIRNNNVACYIINVSHVGTFIGFVYSLKEHYRAKTKMQCFLN